MEVIGIRVVVAPIASIGVLVAIGAGIGTGTTSGLLPGLHVNNLALLLAATAPSIPAPPHLVGATLVTAGVVHSFLDVVPSLALGVPDPEMAAGALPGHRLVLEGRGPEALRLSVLGSAGAVAIAVPLAIPVTAVMTEVYPTVDRHIGVVLLAVAAVLVLTEGGGREMVGGVVAFGTSGLLGMLVLDRLVVTGPIETGGPLTPLFAGLFGAPILLEAARGRGVPPQVESRLGLTHGEGGHAALAGSLAGAAVAYIPGVSAAVAAVLALGALPAKGDRGYLVATSGANTGNAVFALFALVALGTPRTGVMVAFERASLPLNLPLLLLAVLTGAVVGSVLVIVVGERYLAAVGRVNPRAAAWTVLGILGALSFAFAGGIGVLIYVVAIAVGSLPRRFGARRTHLMGVLMVPIAV